MQRKSKAKIVKQKEEKFRQSKTEESAKELIEWNNSNTEG